MENESVITKKINDETLKIIYENYFKGLVFYSLSYTHRFDVAEDIVQDVIINFFEKNRYSTLNGSVLNYLRGAVIKASIKYNRDHNKLIFEDIESRVTEEITSLIGDDHEEIAIEKLLTSIEKLPERSKEIVKLIVFGEKKQNQVAEELSISVNSVKSQYYKSLVRIKDIMNKTYLIFF